MKTNLTQENKKLKADLEKAKECIEFYADYQNLVNTKKDSDQVYEFHYACGNKARQTLKELEGDK